MFKLMHLCLLQQLINNLDDLENKDRLFRSHRAYCEALRYILYKDTFYTKIHFKDDVILNQRKEVSKIETCYKSPNFTRLCSKSSRVRGDLNIFNISLNVGLVFPGWRPEGRCSSAGSCRDLFMASTKTRPSMVFLKDGGSASPDPTPACLAALRPNKVRRSKTAPSARLKHNTVKEAFARMDRKRPAGPAGPDGDSASAVSVCRGVQVTLDNSSMWKECFRCRTEMILTQQGSRMFPYCRFRIAGLQPCRKYALLMDVQPLDSSQYRWSADGWQVSKKAERHIRTDPFVHPESPATGQHWMQSPVSFYKLKLTNNVSDLEGNIILHPLHRYLPRLHLVETDSADAVRLSGPDVLTFSFPQTEFMTVTQYQNPQFARLKVNFNPFAKRPKDEEPNSPTLKPKTDRGAEPGGDGGAALAEQHPVKKSLKFLLAKHKPKGSKPTDAKPPAAKEAQRNMTKSDHPAAPGANHR